MHLDSQSLDDVNSQERIDCPCRTSWPLLQAAPPALQAWVEALWLASWAAKQIALRGCSTVDKSHSIKPWRCTACSARSRTPDPYVSCSFPPPSVRPGEQAERWDQHTAPTTKTPRISMSHTFAFGQACRSSNTISSLRPSATMSTITRS